MPLVRVSASPWVSFERGSWGDCLNICCCNCIGEVRVVIGEKTRCVRKMLQVVCRGRVVGCDVWYSCLGWSSEGKESILLGVSRDVIVIQGLRSVWVVTV